MAFNPSFKENNALVANGSVASAARENGYVLGGCHSDPFQVVFLGWNRKRLFACIYSSETRTWGNPISLPQHEQEHTVTVSPDCQSCLVQNSFYWVPLLGGLGDILKFDMHRQTLDVIDLPSHYLFNYRTLLCLQMLVTLA